MQIKPLNQNHSHESLGKEALLMQGPCSTSAASCLSGKSQVAVRENTVCILCIRSILSFLYALSIMLKALQGSELAGKPTYIASLHSTLNNNVREVLPFIDLGSFFQVSPRQSLAVQWIQYKYNKYQQLQGLHLCWQLI